ncbi:hypothetical protein [Legionella drancourtii]|uniref:Uncharacterized protein n=1 Tax=Legionella drancourtii LLAP12 TaxID=658187 RepID=G9EKL6_9GAMM|nr:hypothetical protein [Legionella drancourtii]EHL32149.1 hypothetical protein LDG_5751 [Legionella drancourtii LLAP12]
MVRKSTVQENNVKENVVNYIDLISQALKDQVAVTQAFIDFGAFLQEQYPGMGLDDLRKKIMKLAIKIDEQEIPDLRLVAILSEGRIRAYEKIVSAVPVDKNAIYKMDALTKGINLFSVVLGEEQFQEALEPLADNVEDEEIQKSQKSIMAATYEISPIVNESERKDMIAKNTVAELRSITQRTLEQLIQQITDQALKKPELYQRYFSERALCVNVLINAIKKNPESTELKVTISSYDALQSLDETMNLAGTAPERLERFRDKLNEESIKSTLNSNPDSHITKFLKVVDYIFKSIITLSIDHWIKQAPLKSTQQQAFKDALSALKNVEKEEIISVPPKQRM